MGVACAAASSGRGGVELPVLATAVAMATAWSARSEESSSELNVPPQESAVVFRMGPSLLLAELTMVPTKSRAETETETQAKMQTQMQMQTKMQVPSWQSCR